LASTRNDAGFAELVVASGGELIPPDQVTGLFEPFRRLSGRVGSRSGSGLGLSIVASVAKAHGGYAQARSARWRARRAGQAAGYSEREPP
jgi:signal transduction histidine kinase